MRLSDRSDERRERRAAGLKVRIYGGSDHSMEDEFSWREAEGTIGNNLEKKSSKVSRSRDYNKLFDKE